MHSVNLWDALSFSPGAGDVTLETDMPGLQTDDSNLIIKAAKLIMNKADINYPIHIKLQKNIPMGAGLGGGSSNAAAVLKSLNALFDLKIPRPDLMELGKTLGADVPFCLLGGTALAEGIGEKLTPLNPLPPCHIVLVCPPIHVSTKEVFGRLIGGAKKNKTPEFINSGCLHKIAKNLYNVFTPITVSLHPLVGQLISDLNENGAIGASMTGTGSTVFGIFEDEDNAKYACNILRDKHPQSKVFHCN